MPVMQGRSDNLQEPAELQQRLAEESEAAYMLMVLS